MIVHCWIYGDSCWLRFPQQLKITTLHECVLTNQPAATLTIGEVICSNTLTLALVFQFGTNSKDVYSRPKSISLDNVMCLIFT